MSEPTKPGWTAGPWIIFNDQGHAFAIMPAGRAGEVCSMAHSALAERDANADLIASAPALYEALDGAIRWLKMICDEADIDPEETQVVASAVSRESGERRELATVTLAQGLAKFEAALRLARGEGGGDV